MACRTLPSPTSWANLPESLSLSEPISPLKMGVSLPLEVGQGLCDLPPVAGLSWAGRTEGHHQAGGEGSEAALVEPAGVRCESVRGTSSMWLGCREGRVTETQHPATHGPAAAEAASSLPTTALGVGQSSSARHAGVDRVGLPCRFLPSDPHLFSFLKKTSFCFVSEYSRPPSLWQGLCRAAQPHMDTHLFSPRLPRVQAPPAIPEATSLFGKQWGQAGRSSMTRLHGGLGVQEPN